jgi:hypothetical protein
MNFLRLRDQILEALRFLLYFTILLLAEQRVSAQEVVEAIFSIKSKAIGLQNVSLKFFKILATSLIPQISDFFNYCFTHDIFPDVWKVGKIFNPSVFSDYRPIEILPCLSKALRCACVVRWWNTWMLNKILDPFQSEFKANHSTTTAYCSRLSMMAVDHKCGFVLTRFGFSKAFDSIEHEQLIINLFLFNE